MPEQEENLRTSIITALKTVRDPELPINIYDLGLIYELDVSDDKAHARMTLTTPNCPMAEMLVSQAQEAMQSVEGINTATVELIWEPQWDPSRISEEARLELEFMGLDHILSNPAHTGQRPGGAQKTPLTIDKKNTPPR